MLLVSSNSSSNDFGSLKTELLYFRDTHKSDVIATPSLFKVRNISHNEKLTNLSILLDGQTTSFIALLENKDALEVLRTDPPRNDEQVKETIVNVGQMCVTLWAEDASLVWYTGYCIDIFESDSKLLYKIEHFHRSDPDRISNLKWKYLTTDYVRDVEFEQILLSEDNCE